MARYSFVVASKDEVVLPQYGLAIGEGIDVFNLTVEDLSGFLRELWENQVIVKEINSLDEVVPPQVECELKLESPEEPKLLV